MGESTTVNDSALRDQVREKYREVALEPGGNFHFHTGRYLAERLGYEDFGLEGIPDHAVESFAGVANPFLPRRPEVGERVLDAGSGAGFDTFIAANLVGLQGEVIGVDMTDEMLDKARAAASALNLSQVSFRKGLLEELPVEDNWADTVISNGVINLCSDKLRVFQEILRVLRPGGFLQFADIANNKPVPRSALENIDLWTA